MPSEPEVKRIQRVYSDYRQDESVQRRRDSRNAGNQAILRERDRALRSLLVKHGRFPLANVRILDVGCGTGRVLAGMQQWGAKAGNLYGVDLLPERITAARHLYPDLQFACRNAEQLGFDSESFDLVIAFTLFSSILDDYMANNIAGEISRVLAVRGAILWYDLRYNNPRNPHVMGISSSRIRQLFPHFTFQIQSITVLPLLVRRLGRFATPLYPALAKIPALRTHYLGLFSRSDQIP